VYSLIVLGIIPGTTIQITFIGWLTALLVVADIAGMIYIKRHHIILKIRIVLAFLMMSVRQPNRLELA